jgi:hypothetical protein
MSTEGTMDETNKGQSSTALEEVYFDLAGALKEAGELSDLFRDRLILLLVEALDDHARAKQLVREAASVLQPR